MQVNARIPPKPSHSNGNGNNKNYASSIKHESSKAAQLINQKDVNWLPFTPY